jgi:hypothetical protein
MNDIQQFEAARCLAQRLLKQSPQDDQSLVDQLFRWVLARSPDQYERNQVLGFLQKSRDRIIASPEDAHKIASAGERWPEPSLAMVLNLDEAVTRN